MGYAITMAGQDITNYSDQMSINVDDTLGQGAGAGSSATPQGRASTAKFNTSIGPMNKAIGAGQPIPSGGSYQTIYTPTVTVESSDTFIRANQTGWGTASDTELWTLLAGTAAHATITSNVGKYTGDTTANVERLGTVNYADSEITGTLTDSATTDFMGLAARIQDGSNYYSGVLDATGNVKIRKTSAGTTTSLATAAMAHAAGQAYNYRFNITGTTLSLRVWAAGSSEPTGWNVQVTDSTWASGGDGVSFKLGTATNNIQVSAYQVTQIVQVPSVVWVPGSGVPVLVRQGEVVITHATGLRVFGGYATKMTDTTDMTQVYTTVECIDYSTSLQRTIVNESYSAYTDIQIITAVMQKYAPYINLQYLPTNPAYTFTVKDFRQVTVEQVLQTVSGVTGYLVWVDYYKNLHYVSPAQTSSSPFGASSAPDMITTFPHRVEEFSTDDNSAINRVTFYGGNYQSQDIVQDVSPLANGNNTIFVYAYYPLPDSSTKRRVSLNGVFQVVGVANGNGGTADEFKSKGGLADVLIDTNGPNATFDVAPASGSVVKLYYRYNLPLVVQTTDETSHRFFGDPYLDGFINDNTVFDQVTGVQRCRVLLSQQSFGLTVLKLIMWKPGIQAGQTMRVYNSVRGINATYLVQEVATSPLGGGNFQYEITLGAWNWGIVDVILKLASNAMLPNQNVVSNTITVFIEQATNSTALHDAWTHRTATMGGYYARSAPVGDGHDAYPGFFTITT